MDQEMQIHPMALFSIVDSYERKIGTPHSIGILLGNASNVSGMRIIEVRASYSINYQSKDDLSVNINWGLADSWTELHKLTYPEDNIVGWFLIGKKIPYFATFAHEYCQKNMNSTCVMLFIDLSFQTDNVELKAYRMISLSGGKLDNAVRIGNVFIPFRYSIKPSTSENLIMQALSRCERAPRRNPLIEGPIAKLESLSVSVRSVEDMERMIEQILEYIRGVITQKVELPDLDLGRNLLKFISSFSDLSDGDSYSQQISGIAQDLLMVVNLSEIAQLQIGLSESVCNLDPLNY